MAKHEPDLMTADEVMAMLKIARASFYRHVVRELPFVKVGKRHRYERAIVLAWIQRNTQGGARHAVG